MELKNLNEEWSESELPSERLSGGSGMANLYRALGTQPLPLRGVELDKRQYSAMVSVLYCLATSPLYETLNDRELLRRGSINEASGALPWNSPERLLCDLGRLIRSIPGRGQPADAMELLVKIRVIAREPDFQNLELENASAYSVFRLFMQLCYDFRVFSGMERCPVITKDDHIFKPEVTCFISKTKCCRQCLIANKHIERGHPAWCYTFDIPENRKIAKLEHLFLEMSDGSESEVCPKCQSTTEIGTMKDICLAPKTLVLFINRREKFTLEFEKSMRVPVAFGDIKTPLYTLTGVIKCIGSKRYKAIVKAPFDRRWFECVGETIEEKQNDGWNHSDTVQMLFYKKIEEGEDRY